MRRDVGVRGRGRAYAAGLLVAAVLAGCSLGTADDDKAGSARIRIEGSSPHPLTLIVSREFYEDFDPARNEIFVVTTEADTTEITLPYDQTLDIQSTGSVYVELRNYLVPTASIRMRVDLDNGEGYDQSATLSDDAALIYYFIFVDRSYR